jgi:hypothetical protein
MSKAGKFLSMVEATDMTVAKEILSQLGGNKFIVMTGAKNLAGSENSLSFKIGRNKSSANWVEIKLNGKDLYDITFSQARGANFKVLKVYNDIYNDMLQEIFTDFTGMNTHL